MVKEFYDDVVVQREGASCRTADELAVVFIRDSAVITIPEDEREQYDMDKDDRIPDYVREAIKDCDENRWCDDPDNGQTLHDFVMVVEGWLATADLYPHWDDGFVIYDTLNWTDEDWAETEGW